MSFEPLTPERRREMTRQHLLEAAAVVFTQKGFHGSSLEEVASRAGFSKGAVYWHFKNKEDLFLALIDDRTDRNFALTAAALEGDSQDVDDQLARVRELLHAGFFGDANWETLYLEFVLYATRSPEASQKLAARVERERELIRSEIERWNAAMGAEPKYPTREFAEFVQALFNGIGILRLVDRQGVTDRTLDDVFGLLYDAMGRGAEPTTAVEARSIETT